MTENEFAIVECWLREAMEFGEDEHNAPYEMAIKALEEIRQYRAIGTVEECQTAVERMKPERLQIIHKGFSAICPKCKKHIADDKYNLFCQYCGQALNRGGEDGKKEENKASVTTD